MQNQQRQLVAILFTDIVGYTAMMQQNETHAVVAVKRYISVLQKALAEHAGTMLNDYGDGSLCSFTSATQAVKCAVEIQQQLQTELKVPLRIGLHVGEIFFENEKVLGDGVNVASRIQSLGQANSILFSKEICDKIHNQPEFKSVSLGKFEFKNVHEPVEVFALANDGLIVPKRNQLEGKLKKKNNFKRNLFIAIALFLVFAGIFYYQSTRSKTFDEKEKSIAILPFEVTGNNEDNLASGLVEDILIHLSKIKEFDKVISNKSSSQYRNTKKNIKEIGEELGAVFLVTGTIQQSGDKIRVSAQLIDSRSGKTIWADEYSKQNMEIFDLETELATQIVSRLKTQITPEEKIGLSKRYTDNVEAYRLYRKGRAFADARTVASFDSAEANYKRALEIDPDYALSYSGLADLYTYNQKGIPQLEAVPVGRDYALKALALDSNLTEALSTLGWIQGAFDYDWIKSKATLEKAIKLNPNYPLAHVYYGNVLEYTGENIQQGIREIKKALQLDPLSVSFNWVLGRNYWLAGEYDSAYNQLKKTIALDSKYSLAKGNLIYVLIKQKKFPEALELSRQLDPNNSWDYPGPYLSYTYASMGDTVSAKAELMKTIRDFPNKSSYHLARCNVILKNYSTALDELEEAYRQKDIRIYNYLKLDPTLDPIRNESRFKALLKKAGLK